MTWTRRYLRPFALLWAAGLLVPHPAAAVGATEPDLAADLVRLRAEVERLSTDVDLKKEELRGRLRALAQQRSDLELELQREQLRLQQLRQALERQKAAAAEATTVATQLHPAVRMAASRVKHALEQGLPFKLPERLADLDKIVAQMAAGVLSPAAAVGRLWSLVEDELRLSRESGIYKQVIKVNGQNMLAEVARLGMVGLYFRLDDGRVGQAIKINDAWRYDLYDGAGDQTAARKQVRTLFDLFRKQVRSGPFTVPRPSKEVD